MPTAGNTCEITDHSYCDTNYMILGLIIQKVTKLSLEKALRKNIFSPYSMSSTFNPYYEKKNGGAIHGNQVTPVQHPFFSPYDGNVVVSGQRSWSADWGGSGYASTAEDLAKFLKNKVTPAFIATFHRNAKAFDDMNYWNGFSGHAMTSSEDFGVGHLGYSNSFMLHLEKAEVFVTGTVNYKPADDGELGYNVVDQVSACFHDSSVVELAAAGGGTFLFFSSVTLVSISIVFLLIYVIVHRSPDSADEGEEEEDEEEEIPLTERSD